MSQYTEYHATYWRPRPTWHKKAKRIALQLAVYTVAGFVIPALILAALAALEAAK